MENNVLGTDSYVLTNGPIRFIELTFGLVTLHFDFLMRLGNPRPPVGYGAKLDSSS
jgi:hypothetical protein